MWECGSLASSLTAAIVSVLCYHTMGGLLTGAHPGFGGDPRVRREGRNLVVMSRENGTVPRRRECYDLPRPLKGWEPLVMVRFSLQRDHSTIPRWVSVILLRYLEARNPKATAGRKQGFVWVDGWTGERMTEEVRR